MEYYELKQYMATTTMCDIALGCECNHGSVYNLCVYYCVRVRVERYLSIDCVEVNRKVVRGFQTSLIK